MLRLSAETATVPDAAITRAFTKVISYRDGQTGEGWIYGLRHMYTLYIPPTEETGMVNTLSARCAFYRSKRGEESVKYCHYCRYCCTGR